MISLTMALMDPEMGYQAFRVQRTSYRRQNGQSAPSVQILSAAGCIHPGTPEKLQLLPEEDRNEEFIEIYTEFALSIGENEGGETYTAPDRILWKGKAWRVVSVRDWGDFGYHQAMAVKMHE